MRHARVRQAYGERNQVVLMRNRNENKVRRFAADQIPTRRHTGMTRLHRLMHRGQVFTNHDVDVLNLQHWRDSKKVKES